MFTLHRHFSSCTTVVKDRKASTELLQSSIVVQTRKDSQKPCLVYLAVGCKSASASSFGAQAGFLTVELSDTVQASAKTSITCKHVNTILTLDSEMRIF